MILPLASTGILCLSRCRSFRVRGGGGRGSTPHVVAHNPQYPPARGRGTGTRLRTSSPTTRSFRLGGEGGKGLDSSRRRLQPAVSACAGQGACYDLATD